MSLAKIEKIIDVYPHPDADRLDLAKILNFQCVIPKDMYKVGDIVVFIQPDNVLPDEPWAVDFRKYAPNRIRAIKLRGSWSEGLVIDIGLLQSIADSKNIKFNVCENEDVTEILNITHYEAPDGNNTGYVSSVLPYDIPKTDEKRYAALKKIQYDECVDVTLKIDGQSWSAFYHVEKDEFGITGRRVVYDKDTHNAYTAHIQRYDIQNKLTQYCKNNNVSLCIRGESYGTGIQSTKNNPYSKQPKGLAIFSVYIIDENRYAFKGDKHYFIDVCRELDLPTVPIIEKDVQLTSELINKYAVELTKIDGVPFEGVVVKGCDFSFKIINKSYDSKK